MNLLRESLTEKILFYELLLQLYVSLYTIIHNLKGW